MKLKWVLSSLVSFSLWAALSPILGALAASKPEMHFPGISAGIPDTVIITAQLADPAIGLGNAPSPTVSFTANPPVIAPGGAATLSWTSDHGDSALIDQGVGPVPLSGEIQVLPAENTIYTLTVASPGGSASGRVIVGVWKSQPIISTIAGNGEEGEGDDDIPAVDSELYLPWGVAVDLQGNLYISDYTNRVRRVDKEGRITTVAGTGERGYSGDGGPAIEARLNYPKGLAIDEEGNLYIADHLNHRIRKVDPQGIITTVAGNGNNCQYCMSYPTSLALDQEGNLYIGNAYICQRITRLGREGNITNVTECGFRRGDGPVRGIYLGSLEGLAVDHAGVVYFSEGSSVRKVEGGMVTTIVSGSGGAMVLDHFSNLYVAGPYRNQVTKIDREGYATAIAGKGTQGYSGDGGPPGEAELDSPKDLTLDAWGNLYIADSRNHRVRLVQGAVMPRKGFILGVVTDSSTGIPLADVEVTITGYPNSYQTRTDSQGVYVIGGLTPGSFRAGFQKTGYIRQVFRGTSTGEENQRLDVQLILIPPLNKNRISTVAGNGEGSYSGDGGPALEAKLDEPFGVAADASGNIYIADTWNSRIRRVDANGMITTVAGRGESGYGGDGTPATQAYIYHPEGVAVDGLGNLYIADTQNHRIRKVDEKGIITTVAGNGIGGFSGDGGPAVQAQLRNPSGLATDSAGNLFIADTWNHRIRKVDGNGLISTVAGGGQSGFGGDGGLAVQAQLYAPLGLAVDSSGNLYIADSGNYRVRKVDRNGVITTLAGNGEEGYNGDWLPALEASLAYPTDVSVDAQGNLLIADCGDSRVRKVDGSGVISTLAGNGEYGYGGDSGPALEAKLSCPYAVVEDVWGDLYIGDRDNHRIRKVWVAKAGISGMVKDASNDLGLPGVTITIETPVRKHTAKTDSNGTYSIFGLIPGSFTAAFEKAGYFKQTANGSIKADETRILDAQIAAVPPLSLTITSPLDGSTVNGTPIMVTGELNNSAEVMVNGAMAEVRDKAFSIMIPLEEGVNPILAEAKDSFGQTASRSIQVTLITRGSIGGTVTDAVSGLALSAAAVSVTDSAGQTRTSLTDGGGNYIITGVCQGGVEGTITKEGYKALSFSGTEAPGQTLLRNAALSPILPVISNIAVSGITMTSATIIWTTDQPADSLVDYGTSPSYGSWLKDSISATSHMIKLANLAPGVTYHFRVTSTNAFSFSSSSENRTFATQQPLLTLAITSPNDAAIITRPDVLVRGTVIHAQGRETGVTVNGKAAMVFGNEFVVNHVPLQEGANTLQAVAKDTEGNLTTTSIVVQSVPTKDFVRLTANTESGISPLEVILILDSSLDLTHASLTHVGPGEIEVLSGSEKEYKIKLKEEGIYQFTVSLDSGGILYQDALAIVVLFKDQMESLLVSKWEGMKAALLRGDIEGALQFFAFGARDRYRSVFEGLGAAKIQSIFSNMVGVKLYAFSEGYADCGALRDESGGIYSYPLTFVQDENGIWKIMGF